MAKIDDDEEKLNEKIDELLEYMKSKGRNGIANVIHGRAIMYVLALLIQLALLYLVILRYSSWGILFFAVTGFLTFFVVLVIINEEINPMYKLAWIIPVVGVPVFGITTYFMARFQSTSRKIHKKLRDFNEASKPYIQQNNGTINQVSKESKDLYNTARYLLNTQNYPVYGNTEVEYFSLGDKMFRKMLVELSKAEKFIFIEYFIIEEGLMWNSILEILKVKAASGVDVRVMYDGTCCMKLLPYSYPEKLKEYGIKASVFSPIIPLLAIHQNNRDHRKIMVIDGKVAFTGGINLADEYINEKERFGHWKDTGIMLSGRAVNSFTEMFLEMWNINEKESETDIGKYFTDEQESDLKGYVIPYGDTPWDRDNTGEQVYLDVINQAKDYVYVMTPYLILDNELMLALKNASKRGVDIRLILPHIPDKKYAFNLARSYYLELMASGVKIYEYTPGFVHAKMFISDDVKAVVGTINLDYRSLFLHFECATYMYGVKCIRNIKEDFDDTLKKSMRITEEFYKELPVMNRLVGFVLRLIAPLM